MTDYGYVKLGDIDENTVAAVKFVPLGERYPLPEPTPPPESPGYTLRDQRPKPAPTGDAYRKQPKPKKTPVTMSWPAQNPKPLSSLARGLLIAFVCFLLAAMASLLLYKLMVSMGVV